MTNLTLHKLPILRSVVDQVMKRKRIIWRSFQLWKTLITESVFHCWKMISIILLPSVRWLIPLCSRSWQKWPDSTAQLLVVWQFTLTRSPSLDASTHYFTAPVQAGNIPYWRPRQNVYAHLFYRCRDNSTSDSSLQFGAASFRSNPMEQVFFVAEMFFWWSQFCSIKPNWNW